MAENQLWNWDGSVFFGGDYNGRKLSELLYEFADEHYENDPNEPHDEPYPGAGYCVCHVCQVLAPMARKLEEAYEFTNGTAEVAD